MSVGIHAVNSSRCHVLDEAEAKRSPSILIALELRDRCLSSVRAVKTHYTCTSRASTGLVLNLSLLNLTNGREQLDEVFIASGPWELELGYALVQRMTGN